MKNLRRGRIDCMETGRKTMVRDLTTGSVARQLILFALPLFAANSLQAVYNIAGFNAYGWYRHGETDMFVSCGFSGWGVPLRTEERSEYVLLNLLPEN